MDFGCFVKVGDGRGTEGLVHVSQITADRSANAKDMVKRNQTVWVKVLAITGSKMSLSMTQCNQATGEDLNPNRAEMLAAAGQNPSRPAGEVRVVEDMTGDDEKSGRALKRLSSPER